MSALERVFAGQVMFTLHRTDPGTNGAAILTRRRALNGALFRVQNGQVANIARVELEGASNGRATWIALWLDGVVAAKDRLVEPVDVSPGAPVTFDRGKLRMGWGIGG